MGRDDLKRKAAEELRRRQLRNELIRRGDGAEAFLQYMEAIFKYKYRKPYRRTWFDPLVAQMMIDLIRGVTQRAMLEFPPRHGKTERGVRMLASLGQGLDPQTSFIYMTYGETLFKLTASETKEVMESGIYREIFPDVEFSNKINTNTHWMLEQGGGFLGTSTKGGATGLPANIFIGDDLLKAVDADSKANRDAAWDAYRSSGVSRLEGGQQAVLLIGQRLHKDDINGRAIAEDGRAEEGGRWHVLSLPAVNNFYDFYHWVERTGAKGYEQADDGVISRCRAEAGRLAEAEIRRYLEHNPNAARHEIARMEERLPERYFYREARREFLARHPLEPTTVRYRDMAVERPPLTPLDDEAFGLEVIIQKRKDLGKRIFDAQYLQDVEEEEAGYFLEEHIRTVSEVDLPDQYEYIIVDSSESLESSADDRAIGVYGKSMDERKIVTTILMDGRRGVWDVYGTCSQIITLCLRFPKAPVLIEGAGGGITLESVLRREILVYNAAAQAKGKPQVSNPIFRFKPDNTKGAKNQRIKLLSAPMEQGYFRIYDGCDMDFRGQFIRELLAFNPEKKHNTDNCIDTAGLSYSRPECTAKPPKRAKREPSRPRRRKARPTTWRGV